MVKEEGQREADILDVLQYFVTVVLVFVLRVLLFPFMWYKVVKAVKTPNGTKIYKTFFYKRKEWEQILRFRQIKPKAKKPSSSD